MNSLSIIKAHQYLYYVKYAPIWSDFEYDTFCNKHEIFGGGGSDCEEDYAPEIKDLADIMFDFQEYFRPSKCADDMISEYKVLTSYEG